MRCEVGDLAIVVGCRLHPENNGAFVTVLCRYDGSECDPMPDWWVRPMRAITGRNNEHSPIIFDMSDAAFPDRQLLPIKRPGKDEFDEILLIVQPPQPIEV